jgi:hypothetical protein
MIKLPTARHRPILRGALHAQYQRPTVLDCSCGARVIAHLDPGDYPAMMAAMVKHRRAVENHNGRYA